MKEVALGSLAVVFIVGVGYILTKDRLIEIASRQASEKASLELERVAPSINLAFQTLQLDMRKVVYEATRDTLKEYLP